MEAVSCTVSPTATSAVPGPTVTVKLPSVTVIGTSPTRGVNTIAMGGFVPGLILRVTDPVCVSTPPASYAWRVMVRLEPARTLMGPAATPLTVGMLNTNGVGMSDAVTSTTTTATVVPVSSALMNSCAWTSPPSTPAGSCDRHELHARSDSSVAVMSRRIRAPRYGPTVIVAVPGAPFPTAGSEGGAPPGALTTPAPSTVATPGLCVAHETPPVVGFP